MSSDGSACHGLPIFQEYPIQSNFLELIPARAQRGLTTFDLDFTCIDADGSYIAVGSNVGVVYLFDRGKGKMYKLKDNEHKSPTSCVKVLISLECLVAIGYKDGAILVFKVPFLSNEDLEKFAIEGLHSSPITAIEWAKNGLQFFSGDENGIVVCTEIDHFEHQSRSRILLKEGVKIVQLSYSHLNLVVSTLFRALIYSLKLDEVKQIGQTERKCFGPFGAVIFECGHDYIIYASRPGQRIWKSDLSGVIHETIIFKSALSQCQNFIQTLADLEKVSCFTDFQFQSLRKFESYLLVHCDCYILLIEANQKIIVASSPKLDPIIDIAVSNNEIFVLHGIRQIMRISTEPDPFTNVKVTEDPSMLEDIIVPFKELSTFVKEHSDSLSVQIDNSSTIFDWLKKKRSASSPANFSDNAHVDKTISAGSEILPNIVSLNPDEFIPVKSSEFPPVINEPKIICRDSAIGNEAEDIVYKVKKKQKKKKKVHFAAEDASKAGTLKSMCDDPKEDSSKISVNSDIQNYSNSSNIANENQTNSKMHSISSDNSSKDNKTFANNSIEFDISMSNQANIISFNNTANIENKNIDDCNINKEIFNDFTSKITRTNNDDVTNDDINILKETSDNNVLLNNNQKAPGTNKEINEEPEFYESFISIKSDDEIADFLKEEKKIKYTNEDSPVDTVDKVTELKYGVSWVQYKSPELLLDISASNEHIFCIDIRNKIYFSKHPRLGSIHWIEIKQPAERIAVSELETVVWVLYKGTVYAALHKTKKLWENTEFVSIARDVVSIAVDEGCGWYAKSNGELIVQEGLNTSKPSGYPKSVHYPSPVLQVAVKNGVLWILTLNGLLYATKFKGEKSVFNWKKIEVKNIPGIESIFLGSQKTGWIIDCNGTIRFITDVTPDNPCGTGEPYIVEASNYLFQSTNQIEQVVRRALNTEVLTNLIRGKQRVCLSMSDMGVWFCKTYDNLLYSNQKYIIGHMWELVILPSTAFATKWITLAASGINNSQGALWCINSTGELFCYCIKSKNLLSVDLPSTSGIQRLQPAYQSLWVLSNDGAIFVRRGITPNCIQGIWWQSLDLSQLRSQQIIHMSCSSFVSWACTDDGEILMRLGSLNPSSNKLNQAWISVGTANEDATAPLVKLSAIGKHFPLPLIHTSFSEDSFHKVYVGPLGYPVWAVDRRQNVYVREGVTAAYPVGHKWTSVPELYAKELCISNSAVWLLESSGKIYRRFGVTEKNPCGDYWKEMPGSLDKLSVTEDDDLWGLQNGSMFCHHSFVLHNVINGYSKKHPTRTISEEDWEDITIDELDMN